MCGGKRRARCKRPMLRGERELLRDRRGEPVHELRGGAELLRQGARERAVLADRQQARREIVAAEPRTHAGTIESAELRDGQVRPRVHAMPRDHDGLAAIHRADRRSNRRRHRGLANERELRVEHDARCPTRDARGCRVLADSALRPHGHVELDEPLQQHEGGLVADPAAGLGALRDQSIRARGDGDARVLERRHLREHATRAGPVRDGAGLADHDRHARWQRELEIGTVRDPDGQLSSTRTSTGHRECPGSGRSIASEIQNAQRAGRTESSNQSDIWPLERRDADDPRDLIARFVNHRHATTCTVATRTLRDRVKS